MIPQSRNLRLLNLERIAPAGCDHCKFWGVAAFCINDELPRPEYCPECDRHVPIKLVRVYRIIPEAV